MSTEKRILLEFHGGYWDGKNLDSHSADMDEVAWARNYYLMTKDGTVGQAVYGLSPDAAKLRASLGWPKPPLRGDGSTHQYSVTDRLESDTEVLVRLQYSVRPPNK